MQRSSLLEDMTEGPSPPYTVGKDGSLSPSVVRCWSLQAVLTNRWSPEHRCLVLESMSSPLSNRGCPRGRGGQRGAARGGGQPGQRLDPQTGLQEHTRYRGPTFQVPSALMVFFFFFFLTHQSFTLLYFCFLCSAATYVKVYLLENGVCVAKKKTKVVKKNLDPTYQQALLFDESPQGKVLQVGQPPHSGD